MSETGGVKCPCHICLSCILEQLINHSAEKLKHLTEATRGKTFLLEGDVKNVIFHISFIATFAKTPTRFRQKNSLSALQENATSPHL